MENFPRPSEVYPLMSAPALPPVATTYGAMFMSCLLITGFWSIAMVQSFTYFWRYPNDHPGLKGLVGSMGILISTQLGLVLSGVWRQLIAEFGDFNGLMNVPPMEIIEFIPQLYATIAVQAFFVWRIVKLTEKTWIVIVPWVLSAIVQTVCGLLWVGFALENPTLLTLIHDKTWVPGSVSLCVTAITDVLLAIIMTILLARRMADAVYRPSLKTLRRLIILSINSGTWTAAFAVVDFAIYWVYRDNMLYVIFDVPVGAMYLCTLLANLNARRSTARMDDDYYLEAGPTNVSSFTAKTSVPSTTASKVVVKVDQYSSGDMNEMSLFKPE